jgi:hypothetical protein
MRDRLNDMDVLRATAFSLSVSAGVSDRRHNRSVEVPQVRTFKGPHNSCRMAYGSNSAKTAPQKCHEQWRLYTKLRTRSATDFDAPLIL